MPRPTVVCISDYRAGQRPPWVKGAVRGTDWGIDKFRFIGGFRSCRRGDLRSPGCGRTQCAPTIPDIPSGSVGAGIARPRGILFRFRMGLREIRNPLLHGRPMVAPTYLPDKLEFAGRNDTGRRRGSDASAASGRESELSEWQRSVCNAAALPARRTPGTATGE